MPEQPANFSQSEIQRYQRQMIMPDVGGLGQRKLRSSQVLIIGAGGLGSPVAVYLARAGVGTIGIVDFDTVDISNLHRQILHSDKTIGMPKVDSAQLKLKEDNPEVAVKKYQEPLSSENAFAIMKPYDVIVNGSDNFPTRYLVNDASYFLGKPLVDGGVLQSDGQVTTYLPGEGCYRCLFPEPPPPGVTPNCADAGVFGSMCGIVGSIQSMEATKLIIGKGKPLSDRIIVIEAGEMEFLSHKRRRNPHCALCGDNPTIHELIDYKNFCGEA